MGREAIQRDLARYGRTPAKAGVGNYRAGQTWVKPAFANEIASKNASNDEPDDLAPGDYRDPDSFKHPAGTVMRLADV